MQTLLIFFDSMHQKKRRTLYERTTARGDYFRWKWSLGKEKMGMHREARMWSASVKRHIRWESNI